MQLIKLFWYKILQKCSSSSVFISHNTVSAVTIWCCHADFWNRFGSLFVDLSQIDGQNRDLSWSIWGNQTLQVIWEKEWNKLSINTVLKTAANMEKPPQSCHYLLATRYKSIETIVQAFNKRSWNPVQNICIKLFCPNALWNVFGKLAMYNTSLVKTAAKSSHCFHHFLK